VAQFVKYECDGKTQYEVDGGDVHLKLLTGEGTSAICCHCPNAAIEKSLPGLGERFEVFNSSAEWMRQSGWRLRIPETLSTVPDIGWSHWSQIIRMLVTSTWEGRASKRARIDSCYHFSCHNGGALTNAKNASKSREVTGMNKIECCGTSQNEASI
jgi:hypothetical protein